ncbi:MAG: hypothetical protein LBF80_00745, partial [Spirochaetaceae bacterium]|nr:hypothetical protein [Spirochaetaceae bacterium]
GYELAFRLIDRLKAAPLPFETVIYFTGDSWTPYAGLNALFDDLYARDDCIVVYCDFPEPPVALTVVRKWGESAAPLELAEPLFRICAETGTPCFFGTGDSGVTDVINERGGDVPALYINGSTSARSIAAKTGGKIVPDDAAALLLRYAETITRNGAQETDINYVFFGVKQGGFFISGFTLVLAALFGVFLIVFLYFFLRIVTKSRLKRIFIPVLAAVVIAGAFVLLVTRENFFSPRAKTDTPPKITLAGTSAETYLTAGAESRILLERRIVSIDIDAALEPLHYRLFFTAGSERGSTETPFYSVYNAPVPYTVGAGRIEFMLGPYPPNPLKLEIALPLDLTGEFGIEALLDGDLSVTQTFAAVP